MADSFFQRCGSVSCGGWEPPADLFETQDGVIARFEIAGIRPEDLELRVAGGELHLRGVRREYCERKKKAYRQMEIRYGVFERSLILPCAVAASGAAARYSQGMLEVFLPRARRRTTGLVLLKIHG
jgi:HSP20 family protein